MDTVEKQELATRTRQRNALTRLSLDYGGILTPLMGMEADLDLIAASGIENYLAISDEAWGIKEDQRDQTVELSQAEVDQDRLLADEKAATARAKIAIERAADEYVLAAKVYDAKVKGLVMGAKEYAALVELEQLANEEAKTGLAIDKEALHLIEVRAKIYLQTIEQKQVEADIAKSKVEVAKAHVRAALAGIEAGEAGIKLLQAQTEVYVAEADKAGLQADVANIFAEIMTKKLTETKLGVGKAEIAAGYLYIQSKLDDTLALYETKNLIETIKTEAEAVLKSEADLALLVEKAQEELRDLEADYARLTFTHKEAQTEQSIADETTLKALLVTAKEALSDQQMAVREGKDIKNTWAQLLVDAAYKTTFGYSRRTSKSTSEATETLTIY